MHEILLNLHMHTRFSDGSATHAEIAREAIQAGLDAVIVTDHNVWAAGIEQVFQEKSKRVLLLVGEEVHDMLRKPQKNHLLIFNAGRDLSAFGRDPQNLINQVQQANGLAFLAHPYEDALPAFHEDALDWVDWQVDGFTGIELWNGLSELKTQGKNLPGTIFYALFPRFLPTGPLPRTLEKWSQLLAQGRRVVAVGGSDAHALKMKIGPFRKVIFPYRFHFACINNHLMIDAPLTGRLESDRQQVFDALRAGHLFVGNDLPAPTRGFRFTAQGKERTAGMGDEISGKDGVTLQVRLPAKAECCLLKEGAPVRRWIDREVCTHITSQPGAYRVEAYIHHLGKRRGWIFSNPIYVK